MPKQKGGYPFTDSWFEFPFWILFIIILIIIGLAAGGIFNPTSSPPSPPNPLIPGQIWHRPEFDITNAFMENGEAVITYATNQPYQGLIVKLRLVDGKTNNPWQDFSIGTKTIRLQPKNLSSVGLSVEGYIDYEVTPVTPISSVPITKDTKNNSGTGNLMLFTTSNKNTNPYKAPLPPPQPTKPEPTPNSTSSSGSGSIVTPPSSKPKILPGVPTPMPKPTILPGVPTPTPKPTILPGVPTPAPKPTILPGVPTPSTQKSSLPGSLHENFWPF